MINWIIPENGIGWSSINILNYIKEKTGNDNAKISYKYIPGSLNVNYRTLLEIPDNIEILNLPKNILKVAEKKTFRLTVRKLLPQYSPKIYLLRQHFLKFPIIVRPDQHQQGRDFKILKSYDELNELPLKTKVTIMHNISMNIGKIYSKEEGYILIDDNVKLISVYPDSFKYGNFMYKIMR